MAEETVVTEVPASAPEMTFEEYTAKREAASKPDPAADIVRENVVDAVSPDAGREPEPAEPAPAKETTAAVAETQPEPATEPAPVGETQEQQAQREKKSGIPQARLDEVTKFRREAERERDAAKTESERLAKELADLKAKPPEVKQPEPVAAAVEPEKPKPAPPKSPTIEAYDSDWEKFQAAQVAYNEVTYPAYVEELADWKADKREIANKKKADDAAAATRKQAEDSEKADIAAAEKVHRDSWDSQYQAVVKADPDFEQRIKTTAASGAMVQAVQDMDGGPELANWLTKHPDEAKRIFDLTGGVKRLTQPEFRRAVAKAHVEFSKLDMSDSAPAADTPAAVAPAVPALPVNPKPNSTKAPRPPSPVNERSSPSVSDPKKAQSFEEYTAAREPQLKTTRR